MALTRAKKKQKVQGLAKELANSTTAIIGTFTALTVAQDFELRKVVRGAGGKYRVLKNKLAAKAGEGTKVEEALRGLKGVSAAAFTSGDPVELAKVFSKWVADNAQFTFKLGIVDGKLINPEEVKALASMPPKEEIYAKLLFLISAPAQRLVTVLNATGRDLAVVVNEAIKAEKLTGKAAPVAEAPKAEAAPAAEAPKAETPAEPVAAAEPAVVAEPEKQAEAAATEAPVEGAVVEEAPAAAEPVAEVSEPVAEADAPVVAAQAAVAEPPVVAEPEKQAEAAATEAPVEGPVVTDEPAAS